MTIGVGMIASPRSRRYALTERTTTVTVTTVTTAAAQPADLLIILRLLKGGDSSYIESVRQRALKGERDNDLCSNQQ